jgi:hypothetical protein
MSPVLIVVAILVFIAAFWIGRYLQNPKIESAKPPRTKRVGMTFHSLQSGHKAEVEALIQNNKKIKAIKRVREGMV